LRAVGWAAPTIQLFEKTFCALPESNVFKKTM